MDPKTKTRYYADIDKSSYGYSSGNDSLAEAMIPGFRPGVNAIGAMPLSAVGASASSVRLFLRGQKDDEWKARAACALRGTDIFFIERGHNNDVDAARRDYCEGCPVRMECLQYGIGELYGLWGGLTPKILNKVRKLRSDGYSWKDAIAGATGTSKTLLTWVPDDE